MVLFKDFDKLDDKMQGKFNRDILLKGLMIFLEKDNIKVTLKSPLIFYKKPVFFVIYLSMFFLDKIFYKKPVFFVKYLSMFFLDKIFYKNPVFFVIYLSMFFLDKAQKHQSLTGLYKNAGSQYKRANEFP